MVDLRRKSMAAFLALVTAMSGSVVMAQPAAALSSINVTVATDSINPGDGQTSLREAVTEANGDGDDTVINLQNGVEYTLSGCLIGGLAHTAADNLTIEGNGATIRQTCAGKRIITNIDDDSIDSTLTLRNVTLTADDFPAVSLPGAAIKVWGPLVLENTNINSVGAGPVGGPYSSIIDGGDMFEGHDPNITIEGGVFANNNGRVIFTSGGELTMNNARIADNTWDGIQLVDGWPVTITNSVITGNGGVGVGTTGQGYSTMSVVDSEITNNDATGVSCSQCKTVTVTRSTISGNGADPAKRGGGVSVTFGDSENSAIFTDSTIADNKGDKFGGGVTIYGGELSPYGDPPSYARFNNTDILRNTVDDVSGARGGGVYVSSVDLIIENGSKVEDNVAGGTTWGSRGGGVFAIAGAADWQHPDVTVTDSDFEGNWANWYGGGLGVVSDGEVRIEDSWIHENTVENFGGGGLAVSGSDVVVVDSTFQDNTSGTGGGISINEYSGFANGSLQIDGSTFVDNEATSSGTGGGGVWANVGDGGVVVDVTNSTFTANEASFGGGIMAMQHSSVRLRHVTMTSNDGFRGANVYVAARPLDTQASVFVNPIGADNCHLGDGVVSNGDNVASDDSCELDHGFDRVVNKTPAEEAALFGPLKDNGGPTWTMLPDDEPGLFLGTIPAARCSQSVDQRNVSRPLGPDCEPGAVELLDVTLPELPPKELPPIELPPKELPPKELPPKELPPKELPPKEQPPKETPTPNVIRGTKGDDVIVGTPGDDIIYAGAGNDIVNGGGGNDIIYGGSGNDKLKGGKGNDRLYGGSGKDRLWGQGGHDSLWGQKGNDRLFGGNGKDELLGGGGRDKLLGGKGVDTLDGGAGKDNERQ